VEADVERGRGTCASPVVPAAAIASLLPSHLSPSAYASTAQPWPLHRTSRMPLHQSQPHAATHARSFSRVPKPRPVKPGSGPTGPSWWPGGRRTGSATARQTYSASPSRLPPPQASL
jgi:hypothetical protein